jgi:type VI protein secretion system component VasF
VKKRELKQRMQRMSENFERLLGAKGRQSRELASARYRLAQLVDAVECENEIGDRSANLHEQMNHAMKFLGIRSDNE